jgi:raffinose/stachyose/melibiose transport system substrate-binding protein
MYEEPAMPRAQRVTAVAAALCAVLVAAACSNGTLSTSGSASAPAAKPGPNCKLHLLGEARSSPAESSAWQQVFADFKAKYHCAVTATWQGQFTGVPQLLNEAHLAGQTVDVVTDGTENWDFVKAGSLMDLTRMVSSYTSRFSPGTVARFSLDGHIWGVPLSVESSSVFFYNATLFRRLGLSAPQTYAQFVHDASVIKARTSVQPVVEGGKDTWEWPMWYMNAFAQTSGNKSVADTVSVLDGQQQFTSPASVQALQAVANFARGGLLTSSSLATDENGAIAAFAQQKAAMMFDGTWALPLLRAAHPPFDVGVFTFPLVVNQPGVVSQPSGAPEGALSIPSFIPKADLPLADQFIEFATSPPEAGKILATLDATVPSVAAVPSAGDPLATTLRRDFLPRTIAWLDWMWPSDVTTAMENAIEGVLFNHQTPAQAAQAVQNQLNTLRQQQNYTYDFLARWSKAQWAKVEPAPVPKIQVTG